MNTREWRLEEINWPNVNEVRQGDIIRIDNFTTAVMIGWRGSLKGAASGKVFGRKLFLDLGRGVTKTLYVVEGHEFAWLEE